MARDLIRKVKKMRTSIYSSIKSVFLLLVSVASTGFVMTYSVQTLAACVPGSTMLISTALVAGVTDAGACTITVASTGRVSSNVSAVILSGISTRISNNGRITGTALYGVNISSPGSSISVENNAGGVITAVYDAILVNTGSTVSSLVNAVTGQITVTGSGNNNAAVFVGFNSTLSTFTNLGTISANASLDGSAVFNSGTISSLVNSGTISANASSGSAVFNSGTISSLVNSGTISARAQAITNNGDLSLINTGTITSTNSYPINININATKLVSITNNGNIRGTSPVIMASGAGVINTLNNGQGTNSPIAGYLPLSYSGKLPTNYNIIVSLSTQYGQLAVTSPSRTTNFGIYSGGVAGVAASSLAAGTYSSVLTGITLSNLTGGVTPTGTYGSYSWALNNSSGTIWDLVVTCLTSCTSGGGVGGGSSGGSVDSSGATSLTPPSIVPGSRNSLSSLGTSSSAVLAGGTLVLNRGDSSNLAISVTSAGGVIQHPTLGTAALVGVISGPGALTFDGTDTTVLSGANTYSGGTSIANGILSVAGSSPTGSGDIVVLSPSTLMGNGTIGGNIIVYGVLKPGNSPGYLAPTKNVTFNPNSTYQQDIAGTAQASSASAVGATGYYSFLNIGGQLIINPGATLTPRLSNLFQSTESGYGSSIYIPVLGDRFRIATAAEGIVGKFSTITQPAELSADTQFLPFYNASGSNSLDLAVVPRSYKNLISSTSGNKNAQSVGGALDRMVVASYAGTASVAQDQLMNIVTAQSAPSLSAYTQAMSGEVYAAAVSVIAQTTQRVQQAVLTRLGDTMGIEFPHAMTSVAGNAALMAASHTALSGGVASSAVSANPAVNPEAEYKSLSNGNVWGDLAYQKGNRSSDSNAGGWNTNLYQLVFGSDFHVENGLRLGGGIALSNTTLNPAYGSGTIQQGSVFAYGKMPIDAYVVDAMASFGLNNSDLSRGDITNLSNGFRSKSISGNDAMVSLGLSRPIDTESVRITPYVRATWQMVTQSAVNEGNVASALSVNGYSGNGVRGVLGVALGSKTNNPMTESYTYRAYVGVGADSSGVLNPTLNASLVGIGTTITTPNAGSTFVQAGLYGTAKVSDNAYAYAGLSGEARSGQTLGTVNIGMSIQF